MKKLLFVLFSIAFSVASVQGQNWLTLKGGGGLALFPGYTGAQSGISINSGLGYKHQISKRMILEGDILLDTRSYEVPTNVYDVDNNMIYFDGGGTYVQIPLTVHYNMPFRKKELIPYVVGQPNSAFFVEGGPYVSYGLSVSSFADPTVLALWESADDPIAESDLTPRAIDFGLTAGFGLNFGFSETLNRLSVGARLNYGLLNVYKDNRLGNAKNMSAVGYLAFDFALTKRRHIKYRW